MLDLGVTPRAPDTCASTAGVSSAWCLTPDYPMSQAPGANSYREIPDWLSKEASVSELLRESGEPAT